MGWISERHMRRGGSIGGCKGMIFKDKPLRKIEYVIRYAESIFDRDYVMLECGHTTRAAGKYRARCAKCRDDKPKDNN